MSRSAAGVAETRSSKGRLHEAQARRRAKREARARHFGARARRKGRFCPPYEFETTRTKSPAPAGSHRSSEEPELLRAVADQHVLGLLVVIEHHLVGFAADTGLLVSAERRMGRIGVIAIGPDAAGLD